MIETLRGFCVRIVNGIDENMKEDAGISRALRIGSVSIAGGCASCAETTMQTNPVCAHLMVERPFRSRRGRGTLVKEERHGSIVV